MQPAYMVGYDPAQGGGPWELASGQAPRSKREMVFDRILATRHGLEIGDRVEVLGQDFTMADAMCGGLLRFAAGFGMFKPGPVAAGYLAALESRPAMARAKAIEDAALAAVKAS